MPTVKIKNPDLDIEKTFLIDDVAAGATSGKVKNNQGFIADDYIVAGTPGNDDTEMTQVNSVTNADTIAFDALKFGHAKSTHIYKARWNQVKIYRSTTKTGTYSYLDTIDLEFDDPELTLYEDIAGNPTSWYKIKYYNSTTSTESEFSDPVLATGYSLYALESMTNDVATYIGDPTFKYVKPDIIGKMIRHQQIAFWFTPIAKRDLKETVALKTVAGQSYVNLPDDFDKFDSDYAVHYRYNKVAGRDSWACLRIKPKAQFLEEYGDNNALDDDYLKACYLDDTTSPKRLYLGPTPKTVDNELEVDYFKKIPDLINPGDETICPVPELLTIPVACKILISRGELERAQNLKGDLNTLMAGMNEHNRTKTGSMRMRVRKNYDRKRFA